MNIRPRKLQMCLDLINRRALGIRGGGNEKKRITPSFPFIYIASGERRVLDGLQLGVLLVCKFLNIWKRKFPTFKEEGGKKTSRQPEARSSGFALGSDAPACSGPCVKLWFEPVPKTLRRYELQSRGSSRGQTARELNKYELWKKKKGRWRK